MFAFVDPSLTKPMSAYLDLYLADPWWGHALQVVPFLAALGERTGLPFWGDNFERELLHHLVWSLDQWSAFRNKGTHAEQRAALEAGLPQLIGSIQQAAPAACLADVPEERLQSFTSAVVDALRAFAGHEEASFVLPSKTAHLLLPTLVPAYDGAVVVDQVLSRLFPARTRDAKTYATWLSLCWWVLQLFRREGTLAAARGQVFKSLMDDWRVRVLDAAKPTATSFVASCLDSYLAEYTLIGMYHDVKRRAGKDWRQWSPLVSYSD